MGCSEKSSQGTEDGDEGSHTVEVEGNTTTHQSIVGGTDDGGSRRGARGRGRGWVSGLLRGGSGGGAGRNEGVIKRNG